MRLILVRHGETSWNRLGRFQGQGQVGLNDLGYRQACRAAGALRSVKPAALYSSPLPRALMTAEEISRELSLPVVPLDGMKEIALGDLEGITSKTMRAQYSQLYTAWRHAPSSVTFPGGESLEQLQDRAWSAFEYIGKTHPDDIVVAVSHGFAIGTILCRFMGLPLSQFHSLSVDLGSMSIIQTNSRSHRVVAINDRCHLDGDGPG